MRLAEKQNFDVKEHRLKAFEVKIGVSLWMIKRAGESLKKGEETSEKKYVWGTDINVIRKTSSTFDTQMIDRQGPSFSDPTLNVLIRAGGREVSGS